MTYETVHGILVLIWPCASRLRAIYTAHNGFFGLLDSFLTATDLSGEFLQEDTRNGSWSEVEVPPKEAKVG